MKLHILVHDEKLLKPRSQFHKNSILNETHAIVVYNQI